MPRVKRCHAPGSLAHVIVRFVNGQFVMDAVPGARDQYLARLDRAMHRTDWMLCWYALMSTHVHLGVVCGEAPFEGWAKPLHSGWASWLNSAARRGGTSRRGPVIAERPKTILVPNHHGKRLGAYLHNNPVRAGVVPSPEQCSWTSHRAYLGLETPIATLNLELGLSFYGCTATREGRVRFHEYVLDRVADPRDPELSGSTTIAAGRRARRLLGSTTELATPGLTNNLMAHYPVYIPAEAIREVSFCGNALEFLERISPLLGIRLDELRGPGRQRRRAELRRMVVVAWRMLGRRSNEMTATLQISHAAASNMLRRANQEDVDAAGRLLAALAQREL